MNENERQGFQLLNACPPILESGKYTISAIQEVSEPVSDKFQTQLEFYVSGNHFTLPPEDVSSTYPAADATGCYSNTLGHVTLKNKTLPWKMVKSGADSMESPKPWMALITVAEDEGASVKEITVAQLLQTKAQQSNIFFPLTSDPGPIQIKPDTLCRVVDLPMQLYLSIMPREDELSYLAHAKKVDMFYKCDSLLSQEGYFSVVTSNRFIPSGIGTSRKSTFHLISLEGFEGLLPVREGTNPLEKFDTVRMVSLCSWNVFSSKSDYQGFEDLINHMKTGPAAIEGTNSALLSHGYVPLRHITRTGESTVSLYRGPLSPFPISEKELPDKNTGDGNIIYDQESGIFDMSYAAAWQLGRLLALKNKSIAAAIVRWRRANKRACLKAAADHILIGIRKEFSEEAFPDYLQKVLCPALAEEELIAPVSEEVHSTID